MVLLWYEQQPSSEGVSPGPFIGPVEIRGKKNKKIYISFLPPVQGIDYLIITYKYGSFQFFVLYQQQRGIYQHITRISIGIRRAVRHHHQSAIHHPVRVLINSNIVYDSIIDNINRI